MANITLKGIPDDLYARLKQRAGEHRRSINAEVLVCLERALGATRVDADAALARADAVRERVTGRPFTAAELERAKERGRA